MAVASAAEFRAEIQSTLEDFTRGAIDFQTLLTALDQIFRDRPESKQTALELIDEIDPIGALQRSFFRVLKSRIKEDIETGTPIPIVSPAGTVPTAEPTASPADTEDRIARRRIGGVAPDPERTRRAAATAFRGLAPAREPVSEPEPLIEPPVPGEDPTLELTVEPATEAPTDLPHEPITVTLPVEPEPVNPVAAATAPSEPDRVATLAATTTALEPDPAPPPQAQPARADPPRERLFVTERREIPPPRRQPLAWLAGIVVILLLGALVLLGPLKDYLPRIGAFVSSAREEIPAVFKTRSEPSAPAPTPTPEQPTPTQTETPPPQATTGATASPPQTQMTPTSPGDTTEHAPAEQDTKPSAATAAAPTTAPETATSAPAPPTTSAPGAVPPPSATATRSEPAATARPGASTAAPNATASKAASTAATGPGHFAFSARSYVVGEDAGMVALRIERQNGSTGTASVRWWTIPDSAEPGDDYADFGPREEDFADGETTRTIYVPIASDDVAESSETFRVQLGDPSDDAGLGATASATVTIEDDD